MHAGAGGPTVGGSNIKDPLEVRKRPFQKEIGNLVILEFNISKLTERQ